MVEPKNLALLLDLELVLVLAGLLVAHLISPTLGMSLPNVEPLSLKEVEILISSLIDYIHVLSCELTDVYIFGDDEGSLLTDNDLLSWNPITC